MFGACSLLYWTAALGVLRSAHQSSPISGSIRYSDDGSPWHLIALLLTSYSRGGLKASLPDYLKPVVSFAYYTGYRRGEILGLRWDQLNLDAKLVRLNAGETKSGEERVLPVREDLLAMLRAQKSEQDELWPACAFVFNRRGRQIKAMNDADGSLLGLPGHGTRKLDAPVSRSSPDCCEEPGSGRCAGGRGNEDIRPQNAEHIRPLQHRFGTRLAPCSSRAEQPQNSHSEENGSEGQHPCKALIVMDLWCAREDLNLHEN